MPLWTWAICAVAGDDAGRLLAAVLEGIEGEEGMACHILAGRKDAKDAALLVELVVGNMVVSASAIN